MTPSRPSPRAALLGLAALCLAALPAVAGSLRLMDYNLLNFPGSTGASRAPYFRTVLAEAAPDLIVAEEVLGTAGRDQFLSLVLDVAEPGLWEAAFFHDGTDTDRALFIRDSCAAVIDAGWLDTDLRDIDWWDLRLTESGDTLRVYGLHLKQILITMGGMIVGEEIIKVIWGPLQIALPLPDALRGAWYLGDAAIEKYRVLAAAIGLVVFAALAYTLGRTKIGLLIRAGVQDRSMVEALGYRIRRLFVGVFVAGSALAGLGGVLWGLYQQSVVPQIGAQVNVLIFIVIIIGGLGSVQGSLVGALLVGLVANYTGFLAPKVALFSNIALMVAILLWRPQGLYPVANR